MFSVICLFTTVLYLFINIFRGVDILHNSIYLLMASIYCIGFIVNIISIFWFNKTKINFIIAIIYFIVILTYPFWRISFIFGRGDVLTHFGYVKAILDNHIINYNNLYPSSHLLLSSLHFVGLDVRIGLNLFPILFFLIYALSTMIIVKRYYRKFNFYIAILLFCPIYYFWNVVFFPFSISFFLLPLFIFLILLRNESWRNIVIMILLSFFSLFHPLMFVIILLYLFFYAYISKTKSLYFLIITAFIVFIIWMTYTYQWVSSVYKIYNLIILETSSNYASNYSSKSGDLINKLNFNIFELIKFYFFKIGLQLSIYFMAIYGLFWYRKKIKLSNGSWQILLIIFLITTLLVPVFSLLLGIIDPIRIILILMFPSILIILKLFILSNSIIFKALLLSICIASPFQIYHENINYSSSLNLNQYTYEEEIYSVEFLYYATNTNLTFYSITIGNRFNYVQFDTSYNLNKTLRSEVINFTVIPDHFNIYNESYMIFSDFDREIYFSIYKDVNKYNITNLIDKRNDFGFTLLYSNEYVNIYYNS